MLYNEFYNPSNRNLHSLKFQELLQLIPGESVGLYIHSATLNDDSIVYDNQRRVANYDEFIIISPGIAHLALPVRKGRIFVGHISYVPLHMRSLELCLAALKKNHHLIQVLILHSLYNLLNLVTSNSILER